MIILRCIFLFSFLVFHLHFIGAQQLKQTHRFERTFNVEQQTLIPINYNENRLVIIERKNIKNIKDEFRQIKFLALDSTLQIVDSTELIVHKNLSFAWYEKVEDFIFLFFTANKGGSQYCTIIKMNLGNFDSRNYDYKIPFSLHPDFFKAFEHEVYFAGYVDHRPVIIRLDIQNLTAKVLPGNYSTGSRLLKIENLNEDNGYIVHHTAGNSLRLGDANSKADIILKQYDAKSNLSQEYQLNSEKGYNLLSVDKVVNKHEKLYIWGLYSKPKFDYPLGIYIKQVDDSSSTFKYLNFGQLNQFFLYKGITYNNNQVRKAQRRLAKNKEFQSNLEVRIREIEVMEDGFMVQLEAFSPRFLMKPATDLSAEHNTNRFLKNHGYLERDSYWLPKNRSGALKGFNYTHCSLIKFNEPADYVDDRSLIMDDIIRFDFKQMVQKGKLPDFNSILIYLQHDLLKYAKLDFEEEKVIKQSTTLKVFNEHERILNPIRSDEGLEMWHNGNVFFAYGIHKIRNTHKSIPQERIVFFINKIVVEP